MMTIDQSRNFLIRIHKPEYQNYILNQLAGDFAVELAKDRIELESHTLPVFPREWTQKNPFMETDRYVCECGNDGFKLRQDCIECDSCGIRYNDSTGGTPEEFNKNRESLKIS